MKNNDRIEICYTVPADEISDELVKFLRRALETNDYFTSILKVVERNIDVSDIYYALSQIKEARMSLVKMDSFLQNATEVLEGYVRHNEETRKQGEDNGEDSNLTEDENENS
jgi:hypothetical protein